MALEFMSKFTRSQCGESLELEGRQPINKALLHLAWHPKAVGGIVWFWLEEHRKRVRESEGIPGRDEPQIAWIYESSARVHETKSWE